MPTLTLDHRQRYPLPGELDSVSMPQLVVAPTSAQPSLGRPACYAEASEKSLLGSVPTDGLSAYSEVLQELQERIGWPVAAGLDVEGFDAVDCLLLVLHVGVQVDVGRGDLLVSRRMTTTTRVMPTYPPPTSH